MIRTCSLTLLSLSFALPAMDSAYIVPVMPGVVVKPIASSGDLLPAGVDGTGTAVGGGATKSVVGILDGLGAWDNGDGTFTVVANQELGATKGATRAHGAVGSFVSRYTINKSTQKVVTLADQITSTMVHNGSAFAFGTTAIDRLCSADLPAATAFYNAASGKGLPPASGRFFMSGEETLYGRAFAHAVTGAYIGQSIQLPHIGIAGWENLVACPMAQDTTIVVGLDDTTPGQVYVYVGQKQTLASTHGNVRDWAEAAGLIGGNLYAIVANGQLNEQRTPDLGFIGVGAGKGTALRFGLAQVGTPATVASWATPPPTTPPIPAPPMEAATAAVGGTYFLRPEDGVWDPLNPDTFYFLTTDRFDTVKNGGTGAATPSLGRSRLWRLVFDDLANPANGGTITMLIDGSEDPGPQMMDNMGMDRFGRILIQEDPGNQEHSAAIWMYDTNLGTLKKVAKHDPSRFGDRGYGSAGINGAKVSSIAPYDGDSSFTAVTTVTGKSDEESSGIIDAQEILGPGWFLCGVQMHSITDMSQTLEVERGQLASIYVPFASAAGATYQAGNLTAITYGTGATKTVLPVRDGGLGSALAPVVGQTGQFWCLTDRGPNVNHPDPALSTVKVFPKPDFAPNLRRIKLNGDGTMTVLEKIDLKRSDGTTKLTGLPLPSTSPGWTGETGYAVDAVGVIGATAIEDASGFDSEGLVAHPDGTFWISDEYGPFIAHFSATGTEIERCSPFVAGSVSGIKLPSVLRHREPNRGMEGLTLTPDGTKLVGIMQSPLANPPVAVGTGNGQNRKMLANRIIEITLATRAVRQFVYLNEKRQTANSEILALGGSKYLVLERDGNFPSAGGTVKKIYQIDTAAATDIHDAGDATSGKTFTGTIGAASVTANLEDFIKQHTAAATLVEAGTPSITEVTAALTAISVTPVTRTLVVDLATYAASFNHDKPEGLAVVGSKLYVINDDDFGVTDEDANALKNSAGTPVLAKIVRGSTTTQDLGATPTPTKAGLQDYTQVLEIDLAGLGSSITVPPATVPPVAPPTGGGSSSSSSSDDSSSGCGAGATGLVIMIGGLAFLGMRRRRD